jgi:hypothetical protein
VSQVYQIYDATSGELRDFEEKTSQGSLKLTLSSYFALVANGSAGIRYLVLDHQFPLGDYAEA